MQYGAGRHDERTEHDPITGIWGRSLQRGPVAEPIVMRSVGKANYLKAFFWPSSVQRPFTISSLVCG